MNLAGFQLRLLLLSAGILCLCRQPVFAQPGMPLYNRWTANLLDDPDRAVADARAALPQLDAQRETEAWLQLVLFLSRNDWNGPWMGRDQTLVASARDKAEALGYRDMALMLEQNLAEAAARKTETYAAVRETFLQSIARAEERQLPLAHAWLASALAYAEYEQGDATSGLEWARVALETILKIRDHEDAETLMIKNTLALILESLGNKKQTIDAYEDMEQLLRKRHFRFSLAIVLCNHGLLLVHNRLDLARAAALYQEALNIAQSLKNAYLLTLAHNGLANVLFNQDQKEAALKHLNEAMESSKTWSPFDGLRIGVLMVKSKILVELGRWQEALDTIRLADNEAIRKDKNSLRTIRYVMGRAHAGLGQHQKAAEALQEAFKLEDAIRTEEREKETSKLHIQMGLALQEQKSQALKAENILQRKAAIIVLSLALVTIAVLGFALRKAGEVKRSRERMQHILDNIEEGILTIGRNMRVESSLSPYLYTLLNLDPQDRSVDVFRHFLAAIDWNNDEKATLRSVLETCLGESRSTWEFNLGQLPAELSLAQGRQWLGLHWQALCNDQGQVQSILVAVRDITETRRLQREKAAAEQSRADAERHLQELLLIDPREARSFVREFTETIALLRQNLLMGRRVTECFRALHTCKGLGRTLGLKELSLLVHDMESQLDSGAGAVRDPERLRALLNQLEILFADYQRWVDRLYPEGQAPRSGVSATLHETIGRQIPAVQKQLSAGSMQLAAFRIDDQVLDWDLKLLEKFSNMLMHGLTNSVDHGFILPGKRGQIVEGPSFVVEGRLEAGDYCVRLRDNGAGLDIAQLQKKAEERGLSHWSDALFLDGMSTADRVSATSGRGVGLAAIRAQVQAAGGQVSLRPNEVGRGTCLEIRIPRTPLQQVV